MEEGDEWGDLEELNFQDFRGVPAQGSGLNGWPGDGSSIWVPGRERGRWWKISRIWNDFLSDGHCELKIGKSEELRAENQPDADFRKGHPHV